MGGITTAVCGSAKRDSAFGALFCFNAPVTFTATGASTAAWTGISSLVGLAVGMALAGTNVAAGSILASIDGPAAITSSKASTGAIGSVTASGDVFKCALIKHGPTGTYGVNSTNYTDVTGNGDEASGAGYTAGGVALTNAGPSLTGGTAFTSFTGNPTWVGATLDVDGMVIYNSSQRGAVATPAFGFHDFGGEQHVTAGTLTVILPVADASNAIYRIT